MTWADQRKRKFNVKKSEKERNYTGGRHFFPVTV